MERGDERNEVLAGLQRCSADVKERGMLPTRRMRVGDRRNEWNEHGNNRRGVLLVWLFDGVMRSRLFCRVSDKKD